MTRKGVMRAVNSARPPSPTITSLISIVKSKSLENISGGVPLMAKIRRCGRLSKSRNTAPPPPDTVAVK